MFKLFSSFSNIDAASAAHPGQPVHCDRGFDVWGGPNGTVFVIQADGTQKPFASVAEAVKACAPLVADQVKADAAVAAEKARLAQLEAQAAATSH